jgi:hypothetical protein
VDLEKESQKAHNIKLSMIACGFIANIGAFGFFLSASSIDTKHSCQINSLVTNLLHQKPDVGNQKMQLLL